jgi:hypothetical protein
VAGSCECDCKSSGSFLSSRGPVSSSGRTLFHGVKGKGRPRRGQEGPEGE